jgi:hypothetical protein
MESKRFRTAAVSAAALVLLAVLTAPAHRGGHDGPHGGALYEGAKHKYHAELKFDHTAKQATVWILDGKAKNLVPIKAKTIEMHIKGVKDAVALSAVPDKKGAATASKFVGKHDRFAAKIKFEDIEFKIQLDDGKVHTFTYEP